MGKHYYMTQSFTVKLTSDVSNSFVITFVISQIFWFWMNKLNIYPKLYVIFFNILFNNIMMKIGDIYVSITTSGFLLTQINIHWWWLNSQHYMLFPPVFYDISIHTYKWVRVRINSHYSSVSSQQNNSLHEKYLQ